MSTMAFINLPVKDLQRSTGFFKQLGYSFNPQFTDQNAACLVISDTIYIMLLVEPFFNSFTGKGVADSANSAEVIVALSVENRAEVDRLVDTALQAGGKQYQAAQEYDFMYSRNFQDLDGHRWEYVWMDPAHLQ